MKNTNKKKKRYKPNTTRIFKRSNSCKLLGRIFVRNCNARLRKNSLPRVKNLSAISRAYAIEKLSFRSRTILSKLCILLIR